MTIRHFEPLIWTYISKCSAILGIREFDGVCLFNKECYCFTAIMNQPAAAFPFTRTIYRPYHTHASTTFSTFANFIVHGMNAITV